MRCKSCDYSLWNMRAGPCPECGAPFKPSDFDFQFSTVKFCCPHCAQEYYGTGARGHLEPAAFTCVRCANPISMDEMVVVPGDHVPLSASEVATNVWEHPGERGVWSRWWRTLKDSMFRPGKLIEVTPPAGVRIEDEPTFGPSGSVGPAWRFAIMSNLVALLTAAIPLTLILLIPLFTGGAGPGRLMPVLGVMGVVLVGVLVVFPVTIFLWAVGAHVMLRLTGGAPFGLGRTVQCLAYGSGPNVTCMVPCIGGYFSWIWWTISSILMIRSGQRVSGGRASAAVLVPLAVAFLTCVGVYAGFTVWAMKETQAMMERAAANRAATGVPAGTAGMLGLGDVALIGSGLEFYALENGGYPQHAIRLLAEGRVGATELIDPADPNAKIPGTGITISALAERSREARLAEARRLEQAMPDGVIAYRFGAYVFTHPGLSFQAVQRSAALKGVWLALLPSRDRSGGTEVLVLTAEATMARAVSVTDLDAQLPAQNALRAQAGLAPLPPWAELEAITPEKPLVRAGAGTSSGGQAPGR
jgi:hypothetical protein